MMTTFWFDRQVEIFPFLNKNLDPNLDLKEMGDNAFELKKNLESLLNIVISTNTQLQMFIFNFSCFYFIFMLLE